MFAKLGERIRQKQETANRPITRHAVPDTLVLKLTTACNLRCEYCYMGHDRGAEKMDVRVLNKILKETDEALQVPITIYLHGGEPLLAWDLIEQIGERVQSGEFKNRFILRTQTNGTILNDKIIQGIKKYGIQVGVSIDGHQDVTNGCRVYPDGSGCTDQILETIERLIAEGIGCGVLAVMNKKNVSGQLRLMQELTRLGVREYVINPLVQWGEAVEKNDLVPDVSEIAESFKEIADFIITHNRTHKRDEYISERNMRWIGKGLFQHSKGYMCMQSPCGAGTRTAAFGADGSAYLCDQMYGDEEFYLGNVMEQPLTGIFSQGPELHALNTRRVEDIEKCRACQWKYVCSGGCAALSYYSYGNLMRESPLCEVYKVLIPYIYKQVYHQSLPADILG